MSTRYDLKGVLSPEERELLNEMLSFSPEATQALLKVTKKFVEDRAQSVLSEMDPVKVLIKKQEYDGAKKLANELASFLESKSFVV